MSTPLSPFEIRRLRVEHHPTLDRVTGLQVCAKCQTPWLEGDACDVIRLLDMHEEKRREAEALAYALGEVGARSEAERFENRYAVRLCLDVNLTALDVGGPDVAHESLRKLYEELMRVRKARRSA